MYTFNNNLATSLFTATADVIQYIHSNYNVIEETFYCFYTHFSSLPATPSPQHIHARTHTLSLSLALSLYCSLPFSFLFHTISFLPEKKNSKLNPFCRTNIPPPHTHTHTRTHFTESSLYSREKTFINSKSYFNSITSGWKKI